MTRKHKTIASGLCLFTIAAFLWLCFATAFPIQPWTFTPFPDRVKVVDTRYWLWRDGSMAARVTEYNDGSVQVRRWRKP